MKEPSYEELKEAFPDDCMLRFLEIRLQRNVLLCKKESKDER